jgi:uncharacterized protein YcbK (DUF882 family)
MTSIGKSLHVSWEELACKDGTAYPLPFRADGRVIELVHMFECIRAIWNKPLTINSAYRTLMYNQKVGGAKNSQHLLGKALDLQPPKDIPIELFHATIRHYAEPFGIKGLGRYKTFIHVDIRDSKELIEWVG